MRSRLGKLLLHWACRLLADDTTKSDAATTAAAALDDIAVSAVLWGLPAKDADDLAGLLLTRGIGPHTARRLFYVALRARPMNAQPTSPLGYMPPRRLPLPPPDDIETDECRVCSGGHDPELHGAVLGLRAWLRDRLVLAMRPIKKSKPRSTIHGGLNPNALTLATHAERRRASRKGGFGNRRKRAS
jgi:hypothetical protein